ncbi:hypothetical protein WA026_016297 [Henosepilachna vigintioctopunctata]|uniref:Uncharacterized protein n=1 Tax=Henosepilachna vigintioctopunctata TaxID=420089 RepID=A0AAW1ULT1_9CUCU
MIIGNINRYSSDSSKFYTGNYNCLASQYGGSPFSCCFLICHHPRRMGRQFRQGGTASSLAVWYKILEKKAC